MVAREEENGIVVLKWKDTQDVRMLSTKHAPVMAAVSDQSIPDPNNPSTSRGRRINRRQGNREKPLAIIEYNQGKSGIDLSDQMASYATTLRRGLKWYRKVAIEFLLGMAVVRVFLVYKKATKSVMQIRKFREHVAEGLLDLLSPQPVASKKHYIEKRKDANGKTIRPACVLCYAQTKKSSDRKTAMNSIKRKQHFVQSAPTNPSYALLAFQNIHIQKDSKPESLGILKQILE
ncbi:uncharacterized protein LOC129940537 [Eupeodes corollae]|uniref:uncharacterized protein LOC129940537 n=1 Tax=Eupeodes corollae TaxID=290404 RepID=UPI002490AB93|nr:uncharacterized protein LOC129940537 [Eupeodes corollae]